MDDVSASTRTLMIHWLRHLLVCAILAMPLASAAQANAAQPPAADSSDPILRIKAAYLYKFAGYVEWPPEVFASEASPIVVGVIGDDALEEILAQMVVDKTVNGRALTTRRLDVGSPLDGVHILFVGALDKPALQTVGEAARGKPILVVSNARQQRMLDSMISFDLINQHLRFNVALKPAASSGLKLRALMLTAARRVIQDEP